MKHTKAIYCQIFVFLYFYLKNFQFFSKQNIWYDDAHELLISKVSIFDPLTFIRVADHHLGFSIVLKIIDKHRNNEIWKKNSNNDWFKSWDLKFKIF